MDKLEKALQLLSAKEREAMALVMEQLKRDYRKVPDVRPLSGMKGWFRARIGHYRILFTVDAKTKVVQIRRLTRRNENTYKRLD